MSNIKTTAVNAIRALSIEAIQKAKSGHPGLPLGAAPAAYAVWAYDASRPRRPVVFRQRQIRA